MPARRAHVWGCAESAQLPTGCSQHRVHSQAQRREAAHHGHRVRGRGVGGAGAAPSRGAARGRGRGRRPLRGARASLGAAQLRGADRGGGPRCRVGVPLGRVGRDRALLHERNNGGPQGCRASPPRHVFGLHERGDHVEHAAAPSVPLDAAHVPLLRLVLPVDGGGPRRHPRLPAEGRGREDLPAYSGAPGDAPVRRADRHDRSARARRPEDVESQREDDDRGQCSAGCGHRWNGQAGHRGDARLRPHRSVWTRFGVPVEGGLERFAAGGAGRHQGAAGRAVPCAGGPDGG
mmetsp:Transcript_3843/g.10231  ORF Transcript_3843/g.10231 Transcript_3843/m.10231 type:complete len:291 (-) Transcript_3843:932-1804(-)